MKQNKVLKIVLLVALVVIVGVGSFFAGQLVSNSSSDKRAQAELKEKVEEVLASKIRLQCDENGEFKVTVLADVHASGAIDLNVQNDIKKSSILNNPILCFSRATMQFVQTNKNCVKHSTPLLAT